MPPEYRKEALENAVRIFAMDLIYYGLASNLASLKDNARERFLNDLHRMAEGRFEVTQEEIDANWDALRSLFGMPNPGEE